MSVKAVRSKSKDRYAVYEEKKELIRTDDATVEVTVKVKKRRDKSKGRKSQLNPLYDAESMAHKTGSWGDLLLRKKKLAESQTSINLNNGMLGEQDYSTTNNNNGQIATNILTKKSRPRPSSHHRIIKIPVTDNIHVQAEIRGIESKSSHRKYKSKHHQQHHPVKGIYRNPAYGGGGICKGSSSNTHNNYHNHKHDERHSCHSHHVKQRDLKIQLPGDFNYDNDDDNDPRCCDACTCHLKNNNGRSSRLEDQASQTSLPILPFVHKDDKNNKEDGSSNSTVKVQLLQGKSPPTKDHEKYQRQQQQNGKQVVSQGTTTTTTTITKETINLSKPKISHSAPNHHNSNNNNNNHRNSVSNNNDTNNIKACHYQYNNSRKNDRKPESDVYNSSSSNSNNNNNNNNTNIPITRMEDAQVQTVKRSTILAEKSNKYTSVCTEDQPDNLQILQDIKKLTELEVENNLLKKDTVALLMQVDKAKNERQEYITTIKELYELAEVLRHENVILIGTQEEHRSLQEKLLEAISENQTLKHHLQQLANVQNQATQKSDEIKENYKQDDLWKVRDVLKEVKTAIAEEIQGLKTVSVRRSPTSMNHHDSSVLELFSMANMETSRVLNDTNIQCDDEIERILHDNNNANAERSDVRSSTQYLEMEMPDIEHQREGRRYITPTPESDASDFSPRFSTPAKSEGEEED